MSHPEIARIFPCISKSVIGNKYLTDGKLETNQEDGKEWFTHFSYLVVLGQEPHIYLSTDATNAVKKKAIGLLKTTA